MNSPHQAGSLTCAHVDMTPQLEMAHGLAGVKLLGVGAHAATRRLLDAHAPEREGDDGQQKTESNSEIWGEWGVTYGKNGVYSNPTHSHCAPPPTPPSPPP